MVIRPFGDSALLVEVDGLADVLDLHARLAAATPPGLLDLVPAARTVLVHVDTAVLPLSAARTWITASESAERRTGTAPAPTEVELPVAYDGPDLADAASLVGLSPDALIGRHLAARWRVAFTGFAPGFGYLVSDDWNLDMPRRATPRTRVPRGAVALAGGFTGAYPRETPGGWQLIGTTDAPLFDPSAAESVLLRPGTLVRFRRVASVAVAAPAQAVPPAGPHAFDVVDPGALATVQDAGRPGRLADGIALSGAADRPAFAAANRLVGNAEGASAIEITLGGFRATSSRDLWIAVTGAWGTVRIADRDVDAYRPVPWPAGTDLSIGAFRAGVRAVLAVRGGVASASALGSAATDSLAGLGPAPLRAGDAVATADAARHPVPAVDLWPWTPPPDVLEVAIAAGPRAAWFTPEARRALVESRWVVGARADRVGIRLDGPSLTRTPDAVGRELPSEGMLPGAVQVPPDGVPVILGPDGPVTGGYPVIGVITAAGRAALAQARPGSHLLLRSASPRR
ncbi:5-oxoprolinase/urea amidolyase family protein [Microbacterium sp. KSW-18]|uniref:5-oxoprolinase/urea amidolyase family protein n=1 Tax=Microbacterium aquilitoris TaxID=3067307 RepID=A0ABU3GLX3_9MICO|nr:5-oxoprolinase/urea amidolyase family protein [Microbacterium sp. KSW-18]MDT3331707.1 5-oxoprolinase/urea amidolyase family protein [Microbacterium sp. KSW-18]